MLTDTRSKSYIVEYGKSIILSSFLAQPSETTVTEIKATEFWFALNLSFFASAFRLGFVSCSSILIGFCFPLIIPPCFNWSNFPWFYSIQTWTTFWNPHRLDVTKQNQTFFQHSQWQALLKPAKLAPDPVILVNLARHIFYACIMQLFLNGPFEEAFASLTTLHSIMKSRWAISTYGTNAPRIVTFFHAWQY